MKAQSRDVNKGSGQKLGLIAMHACLKIGFTHICDKYQNFIILNSTYYMPIGLFMHDTQQK